MAAASAASTVATTTTVLADDVQVLKPTVEPPKPAGPNDRIRIATIGTGIIGFIDTETALKVPGVELVATADLYQGRRTHAKEVFGDQVQTYVDYREILARKDVDAVLICVPDHWHAKMSIDAMEAGKAVYCEKPMIRGVEEGPAVIATQKKTKAVFQVGSQFASSMIYDKVKELIRRGQSARSTPSRRVTIATRMSGAWQYSIPTDASPRRSTGTASWATHPNGRSTRCGSSAGGTTGIMARLSRATCSSICSPASISPWVRSGRRGSRRWVADGTGTTAATSTTSSWACSTTPKPRPTAVSRSRSSPISRTAEAAAPRSGSSAPRASSKSSFTELKITRLGIEQASAEQVLKGYNSVKTFSNAQQKAFAEKFLAEHPTSSEKRRTKQTEKYVVPKGYDERFDHMVNFFKSVRGGKPVYEDATFGYRAAAPALLCNESYRQQAGDRLGSGRDEGGVVTDLDGCKLWMAAGTDESRRHGPAARVRLDLGYPTRIWSVTLAPV